MFENNFRSFMGLSGLENEVGKVFGHRKFIGKASEIVGSWDKLQA